MRRTHARHVTASLADDIHTQTSLTPAISGGLLVVGDNHGGEYVLSSRESGLPNGLSLMLVHDQCELGADEPTLLLDLTGLVGGALSEAQTSAAVVAAITEWQSAIERLSDASRV